MNALGRGGVLWLLAHELRLAWRGGAHTRRIWRILGVVLVLIGAGLGGLAAAAGLRALPADEPIALAALSGILGVSFIMALFAALIGAMEALYQRRDLDLLFSSPLDPRVVLTVRALAVAMSSAILLIGLATSAALWLAAWGAWRAMAILPFSLGLAALCAAVGLTLSLALFRSIGPRAARTSVQVAAAIFGGAAFLAFQIPNFMGPEDRQRWITSLPEQLDGILPSAESVLWLPARAALGEPLLLSIWLLLTITPFVLVVMGFGRRFAHDAAAVLGAAGARRGPAQMRDRPFAASPALAVMAKEWRVLRRDPQLVTQILMQFVYLAPLLIVGFFRVGSGGIDLPFFAAALAASLTLLSAVIAGLLTWLMISAEDSPDLVRSAPMDRARVERAKALAALIPTLLLTFIPALGLAWFSPSAAAWAAAWSIVAAVANASIYLRHQRPLPRSALSTKQKAPFAVTVASGIVNTSWASAAGFCAAGYWPAALIPAFIAIGLTLAVLDMKVEEEAPPTKRTRAFPWPRMLRRAAP